jgi:hypothetical protein
LHKEQALICRTMKIVLRKPVEVPACVLTFSESVVASCSLAESLEGFVWAYDKVSGSIWQPNSISQLTREIRSAGRLHALGDVDKSFRLIP